MDDYLAEGREKLKAAYPEVWGKLDLAIDQLKAATQPEHYQAIGILCRDAMILFANAIFSPDFTPEGQKLPAEDNAKARIEMTLQHFGQMAGSEEIRNLTKAVVAYAMRLHHNQAPSLDDARRTVLFAKLALIELACLMETATKNEQWIKKYGVYKCDACGSTKLEEDVAVECDNDGVVHGTPYLACSNCGRSFS
jgi:hypothetical protein